MAPARAAQLLFLLLIVILIVNGTPVRSLRISFVTREEGDLVGKGPAVSAGEVVQEPGVVVVPVPVPVSVSVPFKMSSLLQAPASGAMAASPKTARVFLKKCFLSIY